MPLTYTGSELVTSVRNLGMVPSTGSSGTQDDDILRHLNEAFRSKILPEVMQAREEYFVVTTRTAAVAGQSKYRIPTRAAGDKLRDLVWYDGTSRSEIVAESREAIASYSYNQGSNTPDSYYMEGNYICLLPDSSSFSGSLEMSFYFRPGEIVLPTSARQVTAVNAGTRTMTVASTVPTSWTTTNTFDVHSKHSGAEIKTWDAAATTVSGTTITFASSHPIDGSSFGTRAVEVGDWVCLAGEAAVPAIPLELHPVLVRAACLRIAEAIGDVQAVKIHAELLKSDFESALNLVENRVEGKPLKLTGRSGMFWTANDW